MNRDRLTLVHVGLANATRMVLIGMLLGFGACQQPLAQPSTTSRANASPTPLFACALGPAPTGPQVLARNLPAPDDLAFDNDGRLLFSDVNAGDVSALNANGSVERLASGLSEPEGIVVQDDGHVLVAEQGRNRVVSIDPQSHAVTIWRAFPNRTENAGIDGIGPIIPARDTKGNLVPSGGDVIVPDSPNGVVWAVTPDGKNATRIAGGMTRPVGAAVDASGRILVADEGGAVWVLAPGRQRFATLPTPDDVAAGRGGHIFVNTLGDNAIHELDAQGRQVAVFAGIKQPQGIALDDADNLYYTEFTGGRIDRLVRTFILQAPTVTRLAVNRYRICPAIARAAGFDDPLNLIGGTGRTGLIIQMVQPGTGSSGALEVQTEDPSVGITVSDARALLSQSQTVRLPQ